MVISGAISVKDNSYILFTGLWSLHMQGLSGEGIVVSHDPNLSMPASNPSAKDREESSRNLRAVLTLYI